MPLRGVKPTTVTKRLKALFYGPPTSGKTTAAIQFPRPYLIDTERGAENPQYVKLLEDAGGAYFGTSDFDDMVQEVTSLLTERHEYRTLVIDPLTTVYNELLEKSAKSLATREDPEGTAFGRHRAKADRKVKHLLNLLLRLDMNVIITSHAKIMWGDGMTKLGMTFDCYSKLDYLFDLVFELQKRGTDRVGIVRKTRVEAFPEGDIFPFNYEEVSKRYGKDVLEKKAESQKLATEKQVEEIGRLIELLKIGEDVTDRWLDKAGAETFAEMPTDAAQKCIDWMNAKIKGEPKPAATNGKKTKAEEPVGATA
jgi:hypothetical protein